MNPFAYDPKQMMHVELFVEGDVCYFGEYIDLRINRDTIPAGKYVYECRHGDDGDWVTPVTIENRVIVNFAGTFITDAQVAFTHKDFLRTKLSPNILFVNDWNILEDKK